MIRGRRRRWIRRVETEAVGAWAKIQIVVALAVRGRAHNRRPIRVVEYLDGHAGDFAENLTTEGIDLPALPVGTTLKVGDDIIMKVTQIGKECHARCNIFYQVGDCVMPREGIFAEVLSGGEIRVGDEIEVTE